MSIFKKHVLKKEKARAEFAKQVQEAREWLKTDEYKWFRQAAHDAAIKNATEPFYFLTRDEFGNVISRIPMYL